MTAHSRKGFNDRHLYALAKDYTEGACSSGKRRYSKKGAAAAAKTNNQNLHAYVCRECGGWHLTHKFANKGGAWMKCRRCNRPPLRSHGEGFCLIHGTIYEPAEHIEPDTLRQESSHKPRLSARDRAILAGEVVDEWEPEDRVWEEVRALPAHLQPVDGIASPEVIDTIAAKTGLTKTTVRHMLEERTK